MMIFGVQWPSCTAVHYWASTFEKVANVDAKEPNNLRQTDTSQLSFNKSSGRRQKLRTVTLLSSAGLGCGKVALFLRRSAARKASDLLQRGE